MCSNDIAPPAWHHQASNFPVCMQSHQWHDCLEPRINRGVDLSCAGRKTHVLVGHRCPLDGHGVISRQRRRQPRRLRRATMTISLSAPLVDCPTVSLGWTLRRCFVLTTGSLMHRAHASRIAKHMIARGRDDSSELQARATQSLGRGAHDAGVLQLLRAARGVRSTLAHVHLQAAPKPSTLDRASVLNMRPARWLGPAVSMAI